MNVLNLLIVEVHGELATKTYSYDYYYIHNNISSLISSITIPICRSLKDEMKNSIGRKSRKHR